MFSETKRRVFTPLMLVGLLGFGAVAAEAREYRSDGRDAGDRVAKGAVLGAAVGTLLQLTQGRSEGRDLLTGAVVGGAFGAVAGSFDRGRQDRYYGYGVEEGYAYGYGAEEGYAYGAACPTEPYPGGYAYRSGYESHGYRDSYRDRRPAERYDRDGLDRRDRRDNRYDPRYDNRYAPRYDNRYDPRH